MSFRFYALSLVGVLTFSALAPALADSAPAPVLAVADVMGQTQLRHFKLWFAGALGNWPLARYELEQIKRNFEEMRGVGSVVAGKGFAQLLDKDSVPPLGDIEKAITDKNRTRFIAGFEKLTAACNACHVEAKVGFIKMQTPTASPFSNQSFPP